jgi:hypothetical protein
VVRRAAFDDHAELVTAAAAARLLGSSPADAASSPEKWTSARSPASCPRSSLIRLRPFTSTTTRLTTVPSVR